MAISKVSNKRKKSIWSKLTGVEDEETEGTRDVEMEEEDLSVETKERAGVGENQGAETEEEGGKEGWMEENYEGQLSVDVYQTKDSIVIKSTVAGVKPEDVDVSIENDMLTIRGQRKLEEQVAEEDYFYQECYWGGFSRSIILPVEVMTDKINASLRDGVLTVTLPKVKKSKSISIKVKKEI